MSVIVVGDIDVAEMEKIVSSFLQVIKINQRKRNQEFYNVPNHETFVAVESDKEKPSAQVQLLYKDV
jgi:zinc protease